MGQPSPESPEERPAPSYARWAGKRIAASAFVLWAALGVVFLIFYVVPEDPAKQFAGKGANSQTVENARHHLGLDQPLYVQYSRFMRRTLDGDLGYSWYNRVPVSEIVKDVAPVTGSLVLGALVFALLVGGAIGLASSRRRSSPGRPARFFAYIGIGLQQIWLGLSLAVLFAYVVDIFPTDGYADFFNPPPGTVGGPVQWAYHLVLPWITLGLAVAGSYLWVVERLVVQANGADDRAAAKAVVAVSFARRLLLDLGWIIGATLFVETIFGLPGLGRTSVEALNNYDIPTIQGILIFVVVAQILLYLAGNLVGGAVSKEWRRT